jgi:Tfp pilus assembly protein PilX
MALVIGLLFLVVLTVLGVAAMQSMNLAARMAANQAERIRAFQQAQAMADYLAGNLLSLPLEGADGYRRCTPNYPYASCDATLSLTLPAPLDTLPAHARVIHRNFLALGSSKGEDGAKVIGRIIESDYEDPASGAHVGLIVGVRGIFFSTGSVYYGGEESGESP